jgi:DNA-directed RNA polymerase specialized sigma24 family protein
MKLAYESSNTDVVQSADLSVEVICKTAKAAVAVHRKPTVEEIDLTKYDPLINKLITEKLHSFDSSDMCVDRDDLFQMGRIHVWEAIKLYDPNRGAKLDTFIYLYLDSRFGNFRNKVTRKNERGTVNLTQIDGWSIAGGSAAQDDVSGFTFVGDLVRDLSTEQSVMERIDTQVVLSRLTGLKQKLFIEYYINGLTVLEIFKKHPEIKYHKIRRELRVVQSIYETLCSHN